MGRRAGGKEERGKEREKRGRRERLSISSHVTSSFSVCEKTEIKTGFLRFLFQERNMFPVRCCCLCLLLLSVFVVVVLFLIFRSVLLINSFLSDFCFLGFQSRVPFVPAKQRADLV